MESLASEDLTARAAEAPATALAPSRRRVAGFRFANMLGPDDERVDARAPQKPRRSFANRVLGVPTYSRIVYRAGTVSVR